MKKKRKLRTPVKIILAVLLCLCAAGGLLYAQSRRAGEPEAEAAIPETPLPTAAPTPAPTPEPTPEPEYGFLPEQIAALRDAYLEAHAENADIVGMIAFADGMLCEPVTQSYDNDYYLRRNWQSGEYDPVGTVFLDFRNDISGDDQNLLLYGHYVEESYSSDRTLRFTPLKLLSDPAEYEKHRWFALLNDEEIRFYETALVVDCPTETIDGYQYPLEELEYNQIDFEDWYFTNMMQEMKKYELYSTGVELEPEDRIITLQTCVSVASTDRYLVIGRQLERRRLQ